MACALPTDPVRRAVTANGVTTSCRSAPSAVRPVAVSASFRRLSLATAPSPAAFFPSPSPAPSASTSSPSSSSSSLSSSATPFTSHGQSDLAVAKLLRRRSRIASGGAGAGEVAGRRRRVATRALFGLFGGGKEKAQAKEDKAVRHPDVPVPFSPNLLAGTFLEGRELACCYRATLDGFSAAAFHDCCDFQGPVFILALAPSPSPSPSSSTTSSASAFGLGSWLRFGAFNPDGYRSTDDYSDTFDAFLFYWPDPPASPPFAPISTATSSSTTTTPTSTTTTTTPTSTTTTTTPSSSSRTALKCNWEAGEWGTPEILRKVGGSGAAVFDYTRGGPQFGADGLLIGPPLTPVMGGFAGPDSNSGVGDLRTGRSRLGLSYEVRRDGAKSLFGEEREVQVAEVLVFCCPEIARLY